MAKHIKILKETTSPTGKKWSEGIELVVGDELADALVKDGIARIYNPDEVIQAIEEIVKPNKRKSKHK